jgi:hypothetical protein
MTRLQELELEARRAGLLVRTYSPGDGVTRYRFFRIADVPEGERQGYFGPANGCYTALGLKEAYTFVSGASV